MRYVGSGATGVEGCGLVLGFVKDFCSFGATSCGGRSEHDRGQRAVRKCGRVQRRVRSAVGPDGATDEE